MAGLEQVSQDGSWQEDQEREFEALTSIFAADGEISLTTDIATNSYTKQIKINPHDIAIHFCFSTTGSYPNSLPKIEVIPQTFTLTDNQQGDLLHNLYQVAREMKGTPMILTLINATKDYLDSANINYLRPSRQEESVPTSEKVVCSFFLKGMCRYEEKCNNLHPGHHSSTKIGCDVVTAATQEKTSEEKIGEKKPPMKTACDVISRIQWDTGLDQRCFVVGYLDRFLGVLEEPFETFSWVDIATVDNNTLAIPRHRIQYFKYNGEVVWDKRIRLENVFGSTGSGITIKDVVQKHGKDGNIGEGKDEEKERDEGKESDEGKERDEEKESDERKLEFTDSDRKGENDSSSKGINRNKPNYFVAIRIDDAEILNNVKIVQDLIMSKQQHLEQTPIASLHITLCTMRLDTNEEKMSSLKALKDLQRELSRLLPPTFLLSFQGLDNFNDRILFSPPRKEPALVKLAKIIQAKLTDVGINMVGTRKVLNPHMTVLRIDRKDIESHGTSYLDGRCYEKFEHTYFGVQSVNTIHLCSMSAPRQFDGFYECLASVNLYDG